MSSDDNLFDETVPVCLDFAPRIPDLARLADAASVSLDERLAPDTFSAGEHLVVAQGFLLRTVLPVLGREVPALATEAPTRSGLAERHDAISAILNGIERRDFVGAAVRQITHQAGVGSLTQRAGDYVRQFGLPNFFFHFTMGYATLRAKGVPLGKAAFDGLHVYPPGFSFND